MTINKYDPPIKNPANMAIFQFAKNIPPRIPIETNNEDSSNNNQVNSVYEYEPSEEVILEELLNKNIATQLFSAQMESTASEHAARMTAMDNATRNAGDLVDKLTINYNRSRQASITKELIEIISGAESL